MSLGHRGLLSPQSWGVHETGATSNPPFVEVFCGVQSYKTPAAPQGFATFLRTLALEDRPGVVVLLGSPGSGKSVTLDAISLACANSFLCDRLLSAFFVSENNSRRLLAWLGLLAAEGREQAFARLIRASTAGDGGEGDAGGSGKLRGSLQRATRRRAFAQTIVRLLVDNTWLAPAPPCFPIQVRLQTHEDRLRQYWEKRETTKSDEAYLDHLEAIGRWTRSPLDRDELRTLYRQGRLALLFDGLDEIGPRERFILRELLSDLIPPERPRGYQNLICVTCRPSAFTDDLRDDFGRMTGSYLEARIADLSKLAARDIISRLIAVDLRRPSKERGLLSGIDGKFGTLSSHQRSELALVVNDLSDYLMTLLPTRFSELRPDRNPLSLRRFAQSFLRRSETLLQRAYNETEGRKQWSVREGAAFQNYGEIVLDDAKEYIRRRPRSTETFGTNPDGLLSWYGQFALKAIETGRVSSDEVRAFLEPRRKDRGVAGGTDSDRDVLAEFSVTGIIENKGAWCVFRDLETQNVLAAKFILDNEPLKELNKLVEMALDDRAAESARMTLALVFDGLSQETLAQEVVPKIEHFGVPLVLETILSQRLDKGTGTRLSLLEAQPLLERSLFELSSGPTPAEFLRLCETVRLIQRSGHYFAWFRSALIKLVSNKVIAEEVRAQALLFLCEDLFFAASFDDESLALLRQCAVADGSWVAACATLGLRLLKPGSFGLQHEVDKLTVWSSDGSYMADGQKPAPGSRRVRGMRVARFPVVSFEYARYKGLDAERMREKLAVGTVFEPATGMTLAEARDFAAAQGGAVPDDSDLEVAAAFDPGRNGLGSESRRLYPWGDSFSDVERDLLSAVVPGVREKASPRPIFLAPTLATPSGISDLTGNIRQLTSHERDVTVHIGKRTETRPKVITFGWPVMQEVPAQRYRCVERGEVSRETGFTSVGFRVVWPAR